MLKIFNTLSGKKEEFQPQNKRLVTFYQCGPTVYWTQHLGNMRANICADLIVRTLEFSGYKVKFVRNYTDVGHLTSDQDEGEDKLDKGARREHLTPQAIADKYIKIFEHDLKLLNIRQPDAKPRASDQIKEIQVMIKELIRKGFAYETELAVYFDVTKAKNYNRLSHQKIEANIAEAGRGKISDVFKKHPTDFALWFFKAGTHQNALQTWPSPFHSHLVKNGEGFPGWHIECSVMSKKYLTDTLDIHMGGIEHIPVHHTNEIAQSEAANEKQFVRYWLHNEHLTVDSKKMAKSEGTSYSLQEIIDRGFNPLAFRFFVLGAHYRSKINFTWNAMAAAQKTYDNLCSLAGQLGQPAQPKTEFKEKFIQAISDDFNIPKGLAILWEMLKSTNPPEVKKATLLEFDNVLGLKFSTIKKQVIPNEIIKLSEKRQSLRAKKKWAEADQIRQEITKSGFSIDDTPAGPVIKKN